MNRTLRLALPAVAAVIAAGAVVAPSALATPEHQRPQAAGHLSHQEQHNRMAAIAVLDIAFNKHEPQKAAEKFISPDTYIQHNPYVGNGRPAFIAAATGFVKQNPDLNLDIKRTVTEGDLVVVQGLQKLNTSDRGTVEIDTFRFNRKGQIVEHWDATTAVAATSANGNPQV
ncbi:ester cyclase [Streptomyces sp. NPDC007851]|uniref:nuclear transport factor 2 family protein n=1 Tax=Streptomyces sp. NPDC007851 TaxID=3155008 RepID=UPI0033C4F72C